jgi:hypothetical protein
MILNVPTWCRTAWNATRVGATKRGDAGVFAAPCVMIMTTTHDTHDTHDHDDYYDDSSDSFHAYAKKS